MSPKSSSKKTSSGKKKGKSGSGNIGLWIIGISALVVALVIGILVITNNQQMAIATDAPDVPSEWLDRSSMGNPEAVVTIETWEDYLCPSCKDWSQKVKPRVIEELVKPGLVRMEFHHFPLTSHAPGSTMAALASECAADQDAFWIYHDRLFQVQNGGQSAYEFRKMVEYAEQLGLDSTQFSDCMTSQKYAAQVNDSYSQAVGQGLNATPSIVVNGKVLQDPFNYGELKSEVEAILAANETTD